MNVEICRFQNFRVVPSANVAGALLMMALLQGCSSQPPAPLKSNETDAVTTQSQADDDDCNDIINSIFDMVQPDRLGISSEIKSAVTLINEWRGSCGNQNDNDTETFEVSPELERLVPETFLSDLATSRFLTRDIIHLRDCLMFRKMAHAAVENSDDELGRIVDLFYYVTRNIAAIPTLEETIPLSTFDTVIFGRGTADARALVYAQLLRQLNIDAVIIRPQVKVASAEDAAAVDETESEDGDDTVDEKDAKRKFTPFLIGVVSGDNIYLFDSQWGLPIPSKAEVTGTTWDIRQPATLAEVLADESILQAMSSDSENPYPIQTADLQSLRVELIGNASFWARRMQSLQDTMSGDRTILIYDPVEDLPDQIGMLTRVASVKNVPWKKQDIGIWMNPEETIRAIESLEENEYYLQRLFSQKLVLNAPLEVMNDTAGAQFGPPTGSVFKTRIQQVIGNYKEAITSYVTIKLDCRTVIKTPFPAEMKKAEQDLKQLHLMAGDDATYWIALSQIEIQDVKAAEDSLRGYASQYRGGRWMMADLSTFAQVLAQQGKYLGAISFLERTPDFDPQKPSYPFLIERWKRLAKAQDEQ